MDSDLQKMSIRELQYEVMLLRNAIRKHRDQKGDDNCWLDDFELYGLLPERIKCNPDLPNKELMMHNCALYYECRKANKLYVPVDKLPEKE
jgi:hypothetical protein